jgi:hypothetical protein
MRVDLHSIQDQTELGSRVAEYLEALAEPHTVVA